MLDRLIELEILVQQAERDTSIKVTDQEVLDQVEQTYQNVRKQFTAENDFRDQIRQARFGSVEEWRRWLADEQRRQLYAQRLIEAQRQKGKLRPIPPTDAQMREFWEQNKEQQPKRPATVSFRQIVIKPVPDSGARQRALQLAESLVVAGGVGWREGQLIAPPSVLRRVSGSERGHLRPESAKARRQRRRSAPLRSTPQAARGWPGFRAGVTRPRASSTGGS